MEKTLQNKKFRLVETLDKVRVYVRVEEEVIIEVYLLSDNSAILRAEISCRYEENHVARDLYTKVEDLEWYINDLLMEDDEE